MSIETLEMRPTGELSVGILDDHPLIRDGLATLLSSSGLRVEITQSDPQAFVQEVARKTPSVAIVDLVLEVGDGLSVVRELHQSYPELPVLVLSGVNDPGVVDKCLEAGASGFLEKTTADHRAVVGAVRAVAAGQRVLPVRSLSEGFDRRPEETEPEVLRALSMREREVLRRVALGDDNLKIAAVLGITERTVKAHVSSLYRKLGQENRTQLALLALRLGVRA